VFNIDFNWQINFESEIENEKKTNSLNDLHIDNNGWADAKSKPWLTRSLVRNSSDAKSNLGYMSDERERAGLTVASGDRMKMIM
jgi:hypothetical protein